MTTIAAIQGDGWVVMGADTQSSVNWSRILKMSGDKVYDNNGLLIAGCGMGRGLDLLQKGWIAPKPSKKLSLDKLDIWMARTFIPKMRKLFIDAGYDMKDDGDYAQHESNFIIAIQGTVYYIDDDYSFDRDIRKYVTSGSGGDYAQGALYYAGEKIFKDIEFAKKAMTKAIDAAKEFDTYSGGETKLYIQYAK